MRSTSTVEVAVSTPGRLADIAHMFTSIEQHAARLHKALHELRLLVPYDCCALVHSVGETEEITVMPGESAISNDVEITARHQMRFLVGHRHPGDAPIPLELGRHPNWSSHLAVPLVCADRVIGVLLVVSLSPEAYDRADLSVLSVVAGQFASYLAIRRLHEHETDLLEREQEARRAADAANRAKDRFLAVVSHELRNPVNVILGWAGQLRTGALAPAMTNRAVEAIARNADMQARLLGDLMDVSRIISGKLRLETRPIDVNQVVAITVEQAKPVAESKGVALTVALASEPATVNGDPARLEQVFSNLVSNAIKFTKRGGRVHVSSECSSDRARVTIQDTGTGIDPEFLPFIFDEFQQSHELKGSDASGLGLGLTVTKHLVERHGGQVEALSEGRDKGAVFVVTLPLIQ